MSSPSVIEMLYHPHCNALVIAVQLANNNMYRILMDNRSLIDILYYQALQWMGLKISDLKPSPNPFYDFTRDSVTPMGTISL